MELGTQCKIKMLPFLFEKYQYFQDGNCSIKPSVGTADLVPCVSQLPGPVLTLLAV